MTNSLNCSDGELELWLCYCIKIQFFNGLMVQFNLLVRPTIRYWYPYKFINLLYFHSKIDYTQGIIL